MDIRIKKILSKFILEALAFNSNKEFYPPDNVAAQARAAIDKLGNGNHEFEKDNKGSGRRKAEELANKAVQTMAQMNRMFSFFKSSEEQYNSDIASGKDFNTSVVIRNWELHGGDVTYQWLKDSLQKTHDNNLRSKKSMRKSGGAPEGKGMGSADITMMDPNKRKERTALSAVQNRG